MKQHNLKIIHKNSPQEDIEFMTKYLPPFSLMDSVEYAKSLLKYNDYWVFLYDENEVNLAECALTILEDEKSILITDIWVDEEHRGNGYCKLLLLNIFYHFGNKTYSLETYTRNKSAMKCYKSVFGEPKRIYMGYGTERAEFSIDFTLN